MSDNELPWDKISKMIEHHGNGWTEKICFGHLDKLEQNGRFLPEEEAQRLWDNRLLSIPIINEMVDAANKTIEQYQKENANLKRQVDVMKYAIMEYLRQSFSKEEASKWAKLATAKGKADEIAKESEK